VEDRAAAGMAGAAMTKVFADILKEPEQLSASLSYTLSGGAEELELAASLLRSAKSIVIAGIGASWHAGMAMHSLLLAYGVPSLLIDASELLSMAKLPDGAVVVHLSRSGRSIEIVRLAERCRAESKPIVAITNSPASALANASDAVLLTHTDFDHGVSITTYTAIGMTGALLALRTVDEPIGLLADGLSESLRRTNEFIQQWRETIEASGWLDGHADTYFLARGTSLGSCHEARLLWEESAKRPATALTTGGFRHGPQEIVREGLRIGMWIDAEKMREQDLTLAADLRRFGASVLLIGQRLDSEIAQCVVNLPPVPSELQFVVDIIPAQIAAVSLAALRGEDCDTFRLCAYIVEDEGGLGTPTEPLRAGK
jgi:glucosamine--fructose-6-phosphate aminotransferase (isomerizing)